MAMTPAGGQGSDTLYGRRQRWRSWAVAGMTGWR